MLPIRALGPSDADEYVRVRRFMLEHDPYAFAATVATDPTLDGAVARAKLERHASGAEPGVMLGAFDGVRVVGLFALEPKHFEPAVGFLWGFFVDPAFRDRGLGAALLDEAIARGRALGFASLELYVAPAARAARHLYDARGFVEVVEDHASPREGSAHMRKELGP